MRNRMGRALWSICWLLLFRPTPRPLYFWRNLLLRVFGANIASGARVMASVNVWAPWNLRLARRSCLGEHVDCYNAAIVSLGEDATVSQYSLLCTASHDHEQTGMPSVTAPITIGSHAWVCADVYVAPGVTIGDGAVCGARASVFKDVEPWTVVGGNPAKFIKPRQWRP